MHGFIHVILKDLVLEVADEAVWRKILEEAGLQEEEACLLEPEQHEDFLTFDLIGATCKVLELPLPAALRTFGQHFARFALRSGNASFLRAQGTSLPNFIANINNLHHHLERDHPNARFPFMEVDYTPGASDAVITYVSVREGCAPIVVGALEEIGKGLYDVEVEFEPAPVPPEFVDLKQQGRAEAWRVSWVPLPESRAGTPPPAEAEPQKHAAPATPKLSFFALHRLVVECAGVPCCLAAGQPGAGVCRSPKKLDLHAEPGLSLASEESHAKLRQLQGRSEEDAMVLLMRGTRAKTVAASWTDQSLVDRRPFWLSAQGRGQDYELSEDAPLADAFISHSWSKPGDWDRIMGKDVIYSDFKATALSSMAKEITMSRGNGPEAWGSVLFWVDKCCIPQDLPELKSRCILLLESFMMRCKSVCVIFTWQYLERLWCVYEWASFLVQKEPANIFLEVEYFVKKETLPLYLDAVRKFSLKQTKCFVEEDRRILEEKIGRCYRSQQAFEDLVKVTAVALMARSMAYCAGRSKRLRTTFFDPWVALAHELGYGQLAQALEGCNPEEWRAEAATWAGAEGMDKVDTVESLASSSGGLYLSVSASKYRRSINRWFRKEVSPVLDAARKRAVRHVEQL